MPPASCVRPARGGGRRGRGRRCPCDDPCGRRDAPTRGGGSGRLERFAVRQDVRAVAPLDRQHRHPPQGCSEAHGTEFRYGARHSLPRHDPCEPQIEDQQQGGWRHHHRGGRVHAPHGDDDEPEQRNIVPTAPACGSRCEAHHPAERGPREEHHRCPGDVGQEVRGEHVDERRSRRSDREAERPAAPPHAEASAEEDRPHPQSLCHPVRSAEVLVEPVPRSGGPEVRDRLVWHPAAELTDVPRPDRVREEPRGVRVQVVLRVGRNLTGVRHQ